MRRATKAETAEALDELRRIVQPGDTITTILRHVSRSGMQRRISLKLIKCIDGEVATYNLDHLYQLACDGKASSMDDPQGIKIGGCGMDMGYALVYSLSATLFRGRFVCIGKGCPANDHSNGDRNYEPHDHTDGGYALRHRWL